MIYIFIYIYIYIYIYKDAIDDAKGCNAHLFPTKNIPWDGLPVKLVEYHIEY